MPRDEHRGCRKVPYKTQAKARKAIKRVHSRAETAVYWCQPCQAYHLTSSRPWDRETK